MYRIEYRDPARGWRPCPSAPVTRTPGDCIAWALRYFDSFTTWATIRYAYTLRVMGEEGLFVRLDPSCWPGAGPVRTYRDGSQEFGPYNRYTDDTIRVL